MIKISNHEAIELTTWHAYELISKQINRARGYASFSQKDPKMVIAPHDCVALNTKNHGGESVKPAVESGQGANSISMWCPVLPGRRPRVPHDLRHSEKSQLLRTFLAKGNTPNVHRGQRAIPRRGPIRSHGKPNQHPPPLLHRASQPPLLGHHSAWRAHHQADGARLVHRTLLRRRHQLRQGRPPEHRFHLRCCCVPLQPEREAS